MFSNSTFEQNHPPHFIFKLMKANKFIAMFLYMALSSLALAQNGPKLRRIEGQGNDGLVLDFVNGMHDSILNSPTNVYAYPLYENNKGPVYVDVYNSSLTPSGDFQIIFNDSTIDQSGNDILDYTSKWKLVHLSTNDTVYGDSIIGVNHVQDIAQWGIKIRTNPTDNPGASLYTNNGFLEATMTFANPSLNWLSGISDNNSITNQNWIEQGLNISDFSMLDSNAVYESVLNGTWAPYRLCRFTPTDLSYKGGPAWRKFITLSELSNLASVDVVFTSDQSKWTRCPVLEMQDETMLAMGGAEKLNMRSALSVDKNGFHAGMTGYNSSEGDFNGTQPTGMGWFPGYAVNLETGERLNMAFGEDSWYVSENGADMRWNPTSTGLVNNEPVFGGKHYIYIFGHNKDGHYSASDALLPGQLRDIPVYDQGVAMYQLLNAAQTTTGTTSESYKREVFADAMWVNIPTLNQGQNLLSTDAIIRLRVSKKYRQQFIDSTNFSNNKYTFNKNDIVGIHQWNSINSFALYPNPANSYLTIAYKPETKNAVVEIFNSIGQQIKQIALVDENQQITIADLTNGLYILKLNDGKNSAIQRFIKQ